MTHKILVADDDFDNRTVMEMALQASGYEVVLATNGEEALAKIESEKPDVVLLDMSMPKMNGWDVARRVRENTTLAHIPLIAFTAHALAGEDRKAKAAGCDDYLAKPCVPKEVVAKIAQWIKGRSDLSSPRMSP